MGRKYSGIRPEDQPMYVNPRMLDFEKRRMFVPIMAGSPTPHPSLEPGRYYKKKDIYSSDYGLNWQDLGVITTNDISAMAYLGNGIVILGDYDYHVWRSIDYGATWVDLGAIASDYVESIAYLGNGIAILGDSASHVYRSTDYGLNWTDLGASGAAGIFAISYLGNKVAVCGGFDKHIYRSTDDGLNWSDLGETVSGAIYGMACLGNGIVLSGDNADHVYRSTDYGANWSDLGVISSDWIRAIVYLGNGIAILGDGAGHVYRSTNYGISWSDLGIIASAQVGSMAYLGNGVAILGDYVGHVWRSVDYGISWSDLGAIASDIIWTMTYLDNGIAILGDDAWHIHRSTSAFQVWNDGVRKANDVEVSELGAATYDDVQDYINFFGDRTYLSGCDITPTSPANGTVAIAAGAAWCKETDSDAAIGKFFNFTGKAGQTLTDLTANIIYLDYNAGTPQVVVATSPLTYGFQQDHILLGVVFRNGNETHILRADPIGIQGDNRSHMMRVEEGPTRSSGMATTAAGTRNLAITAGVLHLGLNRKTTPPYTTPNAGAADATEAYKLHDADGGFVATDVGKIVHNTTDDTYTEVTAYVDGGELTLRDDIFVSGENYDLDIFSYWYYDGDLETPAWMEVPGSTAISNSQYNAVATGLANLTANRFGVHWVYMDFDGHLHVVYGQGDYTANQAEEATVPASLPNVAVGFSVIIAKIICQQGTNTLTITYPWTTVFTSSLATDHGSLAGLADDDHPQYIKHSLATAISDFLVASGAGVFIKKSLAQVRTLIKADTDIADAITKKHTQGTDTTLGTLTADIDMGGKNVTNLNTSGGNAAGSTTAARSLYAGGTGANDGNPGTSGSPKATIQGALDALPVVISHECTICVRGQQNYAESNVALDFSRFNTLSYIIIKAVNSSDEDMYDNGLASGGGNNYLDDAANGKSWSADQFNGAYIWIYGGTGAGQVREISDTTSTRITVSVNWTTNPDATSYYTIGGGATMTGTGADHVSDNGKKVSIQGFRHTGATAYDVDVQQLGTVKMNYNYCAISVNGLRVMDTSIGASVLYNCFNCSTRGFAAQTATITPRANLVIGATYGGLATRLAILHMSASASLKNYFKDCTTGIYLAQNGGCLAASAQNFNGCTTDINPAVSTEVPAWYT